MTRRKSPPPEPDPAPEFLFAIDVEPTLIGSLLEKPLSLPHAAPSAEIRRAIDARRRGIEDEKLDAHMWQLLLPRLRTLIAARAREEPRSAAACHHLLVDLGALKPFVGGFGRHWLALASPPIHHPETPEHDALGRALGILQSAKIIGPDLARFIARIWSTRYPIERAFVERIEQEVRANRRRGHDAKIRAMLRRARDFAFSPSRQKDIEAEIQRQAVGAALVEALGPIAAPSKNETRRRAVAELVAALVDRSLTVPDASRVVGAFLAEPDERMRAVFRRSRAVAE